MRSITLFYHLFTNNLLDIRNIFRNFATKWGDGYYRVNDNTTQLPKECSGKNK